MKLFSIWKIGAGYGDIREIIVVAKNEKEAIEKIKENVEFDFKDTQITEIDIDKPNIILVDRCGR